MNITRRITKEIDLATLLEGESIEVDFLVEITERDGVDEGSVSVQVLHSAMNEAMLARCQRLLGNSFREEIARLMDGDELIDAAREAEED